MNSDNLVGKTLANRYEILEKIGSGGMATVYKAKCNLLNRFVAIKVLRDSQASDEAVLHNFNKEAQSTASLSHHNIVSVYDVGEEDGLSYIVMEYIDGITLKEYIKEKGMLPWQEACDFTIQIGQGLSEAHSQHIIHRDIKPQNILMTKDKTLKVTDFGIARAAASETVVVGGSALGSVHYISPEQARGGYTNECSDIYSLGVVLYEMLTGKVPFDGENAVSVALMHLEKEPANVRCLNMDIPADLAYIVMKAISKEQANRYQNVDDMVMDLHAVLADEPLPSMEQEPETDDLGFTQEIPAVIATPQNEPVQAQEVEEVVGSRKQKNAKKKKTIKTKEQKKADKLAVILAVSTIVLIAVIALGTYFFMNGGLKEKLVPDVLNKPLAEASNILAEAGFVLGDEVEYSLSDTVADGSIISQNPGANQFAKKGSTVKVVVSIGSAGGNIQVPMVEQLAVDEAIRQIMELELTYTIVEEASDLVQQGYVIRQSPQSGTMLNKDDIVTLHVSTGNALPDETVQPGDKVGVPSLSGKTREKAETALIAAGLRLGSVSRKASDQPEGTVISQSPAEGKQVTRDSYVSIILSGGAATAAPTHAATQPPEETHAATQSPATEKPTKAPEKTQSPATQKPDATKTPTKPNGNTTKTKTFSVSIPKGNDDDSVLVKIVANGKTIHEASHKRSEGAVSVEISASSDTLVQAYIDGQKVADKTISFD